MSNCNTVWSKRGSISRGSAVRVMIDAQAKLFRLRNMICWIRQCSIYCGRSSLRAGTSTTSNSWSLSGRSRRIDTMSSPRRIWNNSSRWGISARRKMTTTWCRCTVTSRSSRRCILRIGMLMMQQRHQRTHTCLMDTKWHHQ